MKNVSPLTGTIIHIDSPEYIAFYGTPPMTPWGSEADRAYESADSVQIHESRPKNGSETALEFRYRLEIWPGAPLQDALDGAVVDSGELFSSAEAHAVHRPLQVEDELPGDLATVVVGGHVGPFLRAFAGRGAKRPGHDSSVDDTEGASE